MSAAQVFRSLRHRNARWFFAGLAVSAVGTWIQMTAIAVLVYRITGRSTDVGMTLLCQFGPMLLLGAWAGGLSDRVDKRKMTILTQLALAAQAAVLGVIELTGQAGLGVLYALSAVVGVINALDNPARRGYVIELVPPEDIANVVALNTAVMTGSRIIGPALAALMLRRMDPAWLFLINAASFALIVFAVLQARPEELYRAEPPRRTPRPVRESLSYVRHHPTLWVLFIAFTIVATFAFNYSVSFIRLVDVRWHDAEAFGVLLAVSGVGALAGALFVAGRPRATTAQLLGGFAGIGVFGLALSWAPNLWSALALSLPVGAAGSVVISSFNGLLQEDAPPLMRGRLLALSAVAFLGTTPIGGPLTGVIGDRVGAEWSLAYGALISLAVAGWAWVRLGRGGAEVPGREDVLAAAQVDHRDGTGVVVQLAGGSSIPTDE